MLESSLAMNAAIALGSLVAILVFVRVTGMLRYISNTRVGIVEKMWSMKGSIDHGLIALQGEAGFQADVLRGGFHLFFPLQYRVHTTTLVTISQGEIGYVFARDGRPLAPSQTLASNAKADNFEDMRAFLEGGVRSARSCAKAPTPSISPSSWFSPSKEPWRSTSTGAKRRFSPRCQRSFARATGSCRWSSRTISIAWAWLPPMTAPRCRPGKSSPRRWPFQADC